MSLINWHVCRVCFHLKGSEKSKKNVWIGSEESVNLKRWRNTKVVKHEQSRCLLMMKSLRNLDSILDFNCFNLTEMQWSSASSFFRNTVVRSLAHIFMGYGPYVLVGAGFDLSREYSGLAKVVSLPITLYQTCRTSLKAKNISFKKMHMQIPG